jgi:hypothetical protein
MTNTSTSILWSQFYHHTEGQYAPADAASISVQTASDWSEEPSTQNAHLIFQTALGKTKDADGNGINVGLAHGLAERARVEAAGTFRLGDTKVVLDSKLGNVHMEGDVLIGGVATSRSLHIISESLESSIRLASGTTDSRVTGASSILTFTLGQNLAQGPDAPAAEPDVSFSFINDVLISRSDPVLRLTDGVTNPYDLLILAARAGVGDLYVSGSITVGEINTTASVQRLLLQSDGPVTLEAESGASDDVSGK